MSKFQWDFCKPLHQRRDCLSRHIKTKHSPFLCEKCAIQFHTYSHYKEHSSLCNNTRVNVRPSTFAIEGITKAADAINPSTT